MIFFQNPAAHADGAFELLQQKSDTISASGRANGWAYVVSGGIALGIALPAYHLSDDIFAKAVYSLTETLSVAAFGYGSYLILIDDDVTRFVRLVKGTPGLTPAQRDHLASAYLNENAERAKNVRKIRVISHGLTAALNFLNAATTSQKDLATALYFLGGVNSLAAVSFWFGKSEEEKVAESQRRAENSVQFDFFAGPISGLAIRF